MPGDSPLNGSDYLMLGFDYELRRQGYAGNSCQIILELDQAITPDALRHRLNELAKSHPILVSRPGGFLSPKWRAPTVPFVPSLRVHRDQPGLREKLSDEPLALRRGELFRFDLIERNTGRMDVVFTWTHALMDAPSAEHFLAVVGREDVASPATTPAAQRPKKPLKDRLLLARKNVNQLSDFCNAAPHTVGVRHPQAQKVQRHRVEKFTAEETVRIRANGVKLCGALGGAQFHAAVAMMELHRLHERVGCPSPSYVLPVPVSLRPKGSVEPVFSNQIAMLMVQFLPEQLAATTTTVATLKAQLAQSLRDRRIEAGVAITELSRGLPFPLYLYILKQHGLRGEICSFFYGDVANVSPLLTTFLGATIKDFTHVGATTPSPGIGAIFYYFGGQMRVTVFYLETHFSASEAAEFGSKAPRTPAQSVNLQADIAVVGAGAAGIAAAVSSARAGCETLLLDQRSAAGGTGGFSGLTTLCGLYDDTGDFLNEGFAREFAGLLVERRSPTRRESGQEPQCAGSETGAPIKMGRVWVLQYRPEKFRELAGQLIATAPKLETHWNTPVAEVVLEGNRIVRLSGFGVVAVIDCSGTAEVARAIDAECLATDETTQASAIVFPLCNVTRELNRAAAMAQVLMPLARAGFPPLNLQPSLEPNTLTAKFTGSAEQVGPLIEFLRKNVSGFENCATTVTEFVPARRAGRMIAGQYVLTGDDVLTGRKFPDAVARCAWPIEQWDADGGARFKYLSAGTHYEIPARCLRAAKIENLFMAGKTISADVKAIASARVMGCCLATGAAAGVLAANYLESRRTR